MDIIIVDHHEKRVYTTLPITDKPTRNATRDAKRNQRHNLLYANLMMVNPEAWNSYQKFPVINTQIPLEIPATTSFVTRHAWGMYVETVYDLETKNNKL